MTEYEGVGGACERDSSVRLLSYEQPNGHDVGGEQISFGGKSCLESRSIMLETQNLKSKAF